MSNSGYRLYITDSSVYLRDSDNVKDLEKYIDYVTKLPDSDYINDTEIWETKKVKTGNKYSIEFTKTYMGYKKQKIENRTIIFLGYIILEYNKIYSLIKYKKYDRKNK